ncbi:MAG: type II toxin-antitoxin system mRNA interferase toxin, RelE/StbE family [Pleurocapsa sp. MO_226.B13]|nr:type II toxin-antitoxin system mRNA interferase toxin, RelE/StbE family [Pleurocapsa sp. MO_226.B13]
MRTLVWDSSFKRAFKRSVRKNPQLKTKIFVVLELLLENPYNPTLKAHKLKGRLDGLWACWVEYDCRIIYTFLYF